MATSLASPVNQDHDSELFLYFPVVITTDFTPRRILVYTDHDRCSFEVTRNLAIANRLRVTCAHNTSRASVVAPWPLNEMEMKRRHSIDRIRVVTMAALSCIVCEMVENREIFIPHLYLAPLQGWPRWNLAKMFDTHKTRMIGIPCGEEIVTMC